MLAAEASWNDRHWEGNNRRKKIAIKGHCKNNKGLQDALTPTSQKDICPLSPHSAAWAGNVVQFVAGIFLLFLFLLLVKIGQKQEGTVLLFQSFAGRNFDLQLYINETG